MAEKKPPLKVRDEPSSIDEIVEEIAFLESYNSSQGNGTFGDAIKDRIARLREKLEKLRKKSLEDK